MNTRFIEAFLQVAKLRSFRAAAEHMHLTQAAISNRIASLEEDIGARLFHRETRELKLTAVGSRLLDYGERMLDLEQEIRHLGRPGHELLGLVRIGAVDSVVHTWLIAFLKSLQSTYPGIEVQLTSETSAGVYKALREGVIDIALQTHPIEGEGITSIPCLSIATGWISAPDAIISTEDPLMDLLRLPTITMSYGSQPHLVLRELYRRHGLPAGKTHHVSSISAIVQLVQAHFGNALVPLAPFRQAVDAGHVKRIDCGLAIPNQPLVVSYTESHSTEAIRVVAELACRECDQYVRGLPHPYAAT
ncbi:LysR family transcriptional regulator [Pseudomonas fluorescens]|uniref:HTH-type transcriptional regulator YofA n=1 Tax=Pseudomonas fluorescens TaxID=294 RepID=A0A5E7E2U8_PSEFL|nr:LysR family transcriptional regulator [Pseudomonas fluorescens]VVO19444.1 HTH-type transcriptional regulator YofA [Pseudomonas fluorescens]